jgi:hypothetical protein
MARKARKVYRLDQVVDMIRAEACQEGSQYSQTWLLYQWAKRHKLSPRYVTDLLKGRRTPGPAVLKIFKLEAVTQYRKVQ